ncbi:MAG: phosphatase PAP2 family protein [Chloroflexota bacterium]
MTDVWRVGIDIVRWVQGWGNWLAWPMRAASALGQIEFYLLLMPLIYWCSDERLGRRLAIILLLSAALNAALKIAFHEPRPYWLAPGLTVWRGETSFGLPSGHAQNAVALWGLLAASLKRRGVGLALVALIVLIGLSRLYLGVHLPGDVLGGWLLGGLLLWAFVKAEPRASAWLRDLTWPRQVAVAVIASLLLTVPTLLALASTRGWELPADWQLTAINNSDMAIDPLNPEGALTAAGVLLGIGLGAAWMAQRGGARVASRPWRRVLCYLLGLVGVAVLYVGLKALIPDPTGLIGHLWRYLRYALIGGWVAGGAPALFARLGLAERGAAA